MGNDVNKGYQFTVVNGVVTAVFEVKDGRVKFEKMDRDETWSVVGANIVKTETDHGRVENTLYSDINGDGIFAKMSKSYSTSSVVTSNSNSGSDDHYDASHDNDDLNGSDEDDHSYGDNGFDDVYGANDTSMQISAADFGAVAGISNSDRDDHSDASFDNDDFNSGVWFDNDNLIGSNDLDTSPEIQIQLVGRTELAATDLNL